MYLFTRLIRSCLFLFGIALHATGHAAAPVIDLDANNSSGVTGTDYRTVLISGSGGISITDDDTLISDTDSTTLTRATVTITNPAASDDLFVNGSLPTGITVDGASTSTNLILTGTAVMADYATAIETVVFNNNSGTPATTTRTLTVTVEDDLAETGVATSTIAIAAASQTVFPVSFESGLPVEWVISNGVWDVGTPTGGPGSCHTGTQCAGTVLDGNYPANTISRLIGPTVVLPTVSSAEELQLRFWQWFSYSSGDSGQVQLSVWDPVGQAWGAWTAVGNSIVNISGGWSQMAIDLTAYAGETVRVGFLHSADSSGYTLSSGWYLDDMQLVVFTPALSGDFETGWDDWSADRGVWQVGTPTGGPGSCHTGTQCAGTVLDGNYPANTISRLIGPTVVLPTVSSAEELQLRFWQWFSYSSGDSGQVQLSVWDPVGQAWGAWTAVGNSIVNISGGWSQMAIDLTAYAGETVRLGFLHSADSSGYTLSSGWYLDDMQLVVFTPAFSGDFETGWDDWSADRGVWQVGTPTGGPGSCHTGTQCAGTVLDGNYPANTISRLIGPTVVLPTVSSAEELQLRFWQWFSYSSGDSGQVQLSVWDPVGQAWGAWTAVGNSIVNISGGWSQMAIDLTAYAGETVRVGFLHSADSSGYTLSSGWYLDDMQLVVFTPAFSGDFETGWDDWSADRGVWQVGTPTGGPGSCHTGTQCAGTVLDGNYPANTISRLIGPTVVLPTVSSAEELQLRFWQWFSYSSGDSGQVQLSVWDPVGQAWGAWTAVGNSIVNISGGWSQMAIDLTAYAGETVRLGFLHSADNFSSSTGWYLDDIQLVAFTPALSGDFETGWGDWSADRGVWQVGTPTGGPGSCHTGTQCAGTVLDGNYPANTISRLIGPTVVLPTVSSAEELQLRFWQWFSYSSGDSGQVQLSVWDPVGQAWGAWTAVGNSIVNISGGWSQMAIDLTAYAGETVRLGFLHSADSSGYTLSSGWYLDDMQLVVFTPAFSGDFETGWDDWSADRGVWQVGTPTGGPGSCHTGTQCAGTVLDGNYPANTISRLIGPTVVLPTVSSAEELQLRFWQWFSYSSGDSGQVQLSVWDPVGQAWGAWTAVGNSIVNISGGWSQMAIDLTAYAGETVRLGFLHSADSSGYTLSSGWYLDDMQLVAFTPALSGDFETGWDDWSADRGVWQVGTPTGGPGSCHTGTQCAGTVLDGNYPANTISRLIGPTLVLSTISGAEKLILRLWQWFSYSNGDSGQVQLSVWDPVGQNWGDWINMGGSIVGSSGGWLQVALELTPYAGETVRLGFLHSANSDGSINSGWFIDDIEPPAKEVPPPPVLDLDSDDSSGAADPGYQTTFTENAGGVAIVDTDVLITDPDSTTLSGATIILTNPLTGDVLSEGGALPAGITLDPASTDTQRILTGFATLAVYQTALGLVRYENLSDNPDLTTRIVSVAVRDDTAVSSNTAFTSIALVAANDRPVVDLDDNNSSGATGNNYHGVWTEGGGAVSIGDTDTVVSDPDGAGSGITRATVTLVNAKADDVLTESAALPAGINLDADSTASQRIFTSASPQAFSLYEQAIKLVQFNNPTAYPDPVSRTLAVTVTDEQNATSLPALATLTVATVDDPPVLDLDSDNSSTAGGVDFLTLFVANHGSVAIVDGDATLSDVDSTNMKSATVTVTNALPGDFLAATIVHQSITVSGQGTDTLTFSNLASSSDYLTALRGVQFNNLLAAPGTATRIITTTVTDPTNVVNSPAAVTTVNIIETPVVDLDANDSTGATGPDYHTRFTTGIAMPVLISDGPAISDGDSTNIAGISVTLVNPQTSDTLFVDGALPTGINNVTPATSNTTVVLTGSASKADYEAALGLIKFDNPSPIPGATPRSVTVVATDETGYTGNTATATIGIDTDFAVTFGHLPEILLTADNLSYTITVTNLNAAQATDVVLTDILPDGMIYNSASGIGWDCNEFLAGDNSTVICTLPALDSGASTTVTVNVVTPIESGRITNTVIVSSSDPTFGTGGGTQESLVVDFNVYGFTDQQEVPVSAGTDRGTALALSGDVVAAGAPSTAGGRGAVTLAQRIDGEWFEKAVLTRQGGVIHDEFGRSVAFDGKWLVVGAPQAAEAWVYQVDMDTLTFTPQQLLPSDSLIAGFGYSVALEGDTILVGAPGADTGGGTFRGKVYVFKRNGTTWIESQVINPSVLPSAGAADSWRFGHAVALQDGVMAIGAPAEAGALLPGRSFIYTRNADNWILSQELANPDNDYMDRFGWSLALDGDTLVVGSELNPTGGVDSGSAHIYIKSGGVWSHLERIANPEPLGFEQFSQSLTLQGDTLVAGAPFARSIEADADPSGSSYIFQRTGGHFVLQQKRSSDTACINEQYGAAVALESTTLIVGAPRVQCGSGSGNVYAYTLDVGMREIKLTAPSPVIEAHFGHAVDISGDTVVIGAPDDIGNQGMVDGAVYVYQRDASGDWPLQQTLTATDLYNSPSQFGEAVAIDGDTLVVGAPNDEASGVEAGSAYVYERNAGNWSLQQIVTGSGTLATDRFGQAVDIEGNILVVGAPQHDLGGTNTGSIFAYHRIGTNWLAEGELQGSMTAANDEFGSSISLSGNTLAVSAPFAGDVYVLVRNSDWSEEQRITVSGATGMAVAMDGDRLAMGDPQSSLPPSMHTWTRNAGVWSSEQQVFGSDNPSPGSFGISVALLGNELLAGAPDADGMENTSGAVYPYNHVETRWKSQIKLIASDGETDDKYGGDNTTLQGQSAVALSRNARVVGAPFEDGNSIDNNYGAAYVYPTGVLATPAGGVYGTKQLVALNCSGCSAIYYTIDGSPVTEDGVTPTASAQLYVSPIAITGSTMLQYFSLDAKGNADVVTTEYYLVDATTPTVSVYTPADGSEIHTSPLVLAPITGNASDNVGGSGIHVVQVEIRDAATGDYILTTDGTAPSRGPIQRWLTADGTDSWSLPFTGVVHPFEEGHTYNVRVRSFDKVGNVSPIETLSFGYYTQAKSFTTLNLNLSANSILNVPGSSLSGDGQIDASVKLTVPGNLGADLSGSVIELEILAPDGQPISQSPLQLSTNANGQLTLQNLGDGDAGDWNPDPGIDTTDSIDVDFITEGIWTLQAHYAGDLTHQPASSRVYSLLVGQSAGSAVIVVGRLGGTNEGLASHNKTARRIYDTLIERSFQPNDITFLSPDTNRDGIIDSLDGQGCNDADGCNDIGSGLPNGIDGSTDKASVQAAIENLATSSNANPAPRYVFFVDHGLQDKFILSDSEDITPADLASWLYSQEALLTGSAAQKPTVVVLGMCYSGSFLNAVAADDASPVDRIIIASATGNEESYKGTEEADGVRVGEFFLEEWIKQAGRGHSLKTAFDYSTKQTEIFTRKGDGVLTVPFNDYAAQHPLLEDNRLFDPLDLAANNALLDSNGADGVLADTVYLGAGPTYATNAASNPADILAVTDTVFLPSTSYTALITLTANDNSKVASAWIEVREPPTTLTPQNNSIQLDPVLDKSILFPPVPTVLESFYTTYMNFTTPGKYEIFYTIADTTSGDISPIRRSVVYKNKVSNTPPTHFNLLAPADDANTRTELAFDWSSSSDIDGLTYTLEIATDSSFTNVVHRQEELSLSHTTVLDEAGLADLTTYYWRTIAVDGFGVRTVGTDAATGNPYRRFHTDNTNARTGFIYVTVSDAVEHVPLSGAVVGVNENPSKLNVYEDAGQYLLAIEPAGLYTVTASLTGYAPNSESGVNADDTQTTSIRIDLITAGVDTDGDGLSDNFEISIGTEPTVRDSDGDGLDDNIEVGFNGNLADYDPYDPVSNPTGTDLNANLSDTDFDGLDDLTEVTYGSANEAINENLYPNIADGDVKPDGNLNAGDLVVAQRITLGLIPATNVELAYGDMNQDGVITVPDLLLIMKAVMAIP